MDTPVESICAYEKTKPAPGVALDVKLMTGGVSKLNPDG